MLPFVGTLGIAVAALSRSVRVVGAFVCAVLLMLMPWIATSLIWHDSFFASDNSGVALAADPQAYVTDWYPPDAERPSLFTNPIGWLEKIKSNIASLSHAILTGLGRPSTYLLSSAVAAIALQPRGLWKVGLQLLADVKSRRTLLVLAWFAMAALSMLPAYVAVGYCDARYFSLLYWFIFLFTTSIATMAWRVSVGRANIECVFLILFSVMLAIWIAVVMPAKVVKDAKSFPRVPEFDAIASCVTSSADGSARRILLTDPTLAARLSAVHGMRTAFLPSNFARVRQRDEDLALFLRTWDIGYLGGDVALIERVFPPTMRQPNTGGCGIALYRVGLLP
jgi:hypothetical protein